MSIQSASPTVTVITATYNCRATLQLALSSLLNQTFTDFEAWIIGDACSDDSEAVVAAFDDDRLHWVNLPQNSGSQAAPNNEGLRRARGQYIAYLGHDDLWLPTHLAGLVNCIEAQQADFVHSLCALVEPTGIRECIGVPNGRLTYLRHGLPPSSWLYRRDLIDLCGPWGDPATIACQIDLDYMRRIYLASKSFVFYPQLTLLKFPSANFRIYAHDGDPPQLNYWQAIQVDPAAVEHEVLLALSLEVARAQPGWNESVLTHLARAFQAGVRQVRYVTEDHYPFSRLWHWRFQRRRRSIRRRRGLTS